MRPVSFLVFTVLAAGGGGQAQKPAENPEPASEKPAAESAPAEPKPEAKADADPAPAPVPTECSSKGSKFCLPDSKFTKRMCNDSYPSVGLYLSGNGNPFTHGFLTRKTQAWN